MSQAWTTEEGCIYSEQDRSKMPLELGSALSIEREPVNDPEIRIQALEAIYLISLQELLHHTNNTIYFSHRCQFTSLISN
ncbi:hypothetical protein RIF29_14736 [Crotalaria pallida]|uniref:Uncharacterized protein n=1 Tax=Crotalaria pallida TaxID=3830 RepID=A0AAN9FC62_CROPI